MSRAARRALFVLWFSLGAACACGRKAPPAADAPAPLAPPPPAPQALLADGSLGDVAATWKVLRDRIGGRALAVPSTFPLAVTTFLGASPLSAGLVDDRAPLGLALVEAGGDVTWLVGVELTSGPELVASLTTGTDARFSAEPRTAMGLTPLIQKGAALPLALGVAGDALVIASRRDALDVAGAYVGRTLLPSLKDHEGLLLSAPRSALAGPIAGRLERLSTSWVGALVAADRDARLGHGRDPDFGDPRVLTDALQALATDVRGVIASGTGMTLSAKFAGAALDVRIELSPGASGPAADAARDLVIGDATPIGAAPATVTAIVVHRARPGTAAERPMLGRILGERLSPADDRRLKVVSDAVFAGFGDAKILGLAESEAGPALFLRGEHGDPKGFGRAVLAVPELLRVKALSDLLAARGVVLGAAPRTVNVAGARGLTSVRITSAAGAGTKIPALEVVAAEEPVPAVAIGGDGAARGALSAIVGSGPSLSKDEFVARAVARAASNAALSAVVRFGRPPGPEGFGSFICGTDRHVLFAEISVSEGAVRAELPRLLAPPTTSAVVP